MSWPRAPPSARSVSALDKTENLRESRKKTQRPATRRLVQLYAALLYNANLKGFIDGHIYTGNLKAACVPGFNCYSCPGAIASCPLGALQNALNAAGHTAPWYILGILSLFGVILGRTVCGWICPLGLIQELLHKIPTPKLRKNRFTRKLTWLKYVILAVFVIALPLIWGIGKGVILPAFCKYICPAGTLEGAVGLLQHPANSSSFLQLKAVFTGKWVIMLVIGLACVFCYRAFCRFICPLGAIYGFFNRFSLTGVKVNPDRCSGCGACVRKCPMDVRHIGDRECISCGKCIDACAQGAISLKCGTITLKGPETGRNADPEPVIRRRRKAGRVAWGIALAVLVFAVCWFNFIEPALTGAAPSAAVAAEPAADVSGLTVGTEVGNLAPDFSTDLLSGETFRLSDYRGRVVILNFWATTCAPCVEELPFYEQLKVAYPDVEILAVHNKAGARKAAEFLAGRGWDHLDFALDSSGKRILPLLNASDAMPQTIILNRQGVVTYNAQNPLTYEKLEALYKAARTDDAETRTDPPAAAASVPAPVTPVSAPAVSAPVAVSPVFGQGAVPALKKNETKEEAYSVTVTDSQGNPVADVIIGFCTDAACRNSDPSGPDGKVSILLPPGRYHITVVDLPDAYEAPADPEIYVTSESPDAALQLSLR